MNAVLLLILALALIAVDNLAKRRLSFAEVVGGVLVVYALALLL